MVRSTVEGRYYSYKYSAEGWTRAIDFFPAGDRQYALFLGFEGRADEALIKARRAIEIDPLSPLINMNVGWTYFSSDSIARSWR